MSLYEKYKSSYLEIPIIINCRDYLSYTKSLTEYFIGIGFKNILLLDNDSSYPPLLKWYDSLHGNKFIRVIKLGINKGHLALWDNNKPLFIGESTPFIYTDPDIIPIDNCPKDFVLKMLEVLDKFPQFSKCAFEIDSDSLPDNSKYKSRQIIFNKLIRSEAPVMHGVYAGANDTTLALYRPNAAPSIYCALLTHPYTIKHLPWYDDNKMTMEEQDYYISNARNDITGLKDKKKGEEFLISLLRRKRAGESIKELFSPRPKNFLYKLKRSIRKRYWEFLDKFNLDKTNYF